MTRRRARFQSLALAADDDSTDLQKAQFAEAKESYFNGLDRLAWAVLAGYCRDANMKQDYHEQLTAVMRTYPADFSASTYYRNIVKLRKQWDDER